MPLQDFHYGMMEMITDTDFLYSTLTRDLYFLGIVLAKNINFCIGVTAFLCTGSLPP